VRRGGTGAEIIGLAAHHPGWTFTAAPDWTEHRRTWREMLSHTGVPPERIEAMCSGLGTQVAVTPPRELAALIASAGFTAPVRFYQALLMHGHHARRA